jgi:hypothetical protein
MTAITDLSWQQLAAILGGNSKVFLGEDPDGNIGVLISVTGVNGDAASALTSAGVVKFLMRLRDAAATAQATANAQDGVTESLAAFPPATTEGNIVDGYVVQLGSIRAAIAVASATTVVGPTAPVS